MYCRRYTRVKKKKVPQTELSSEEQGSRLGSTGFSWQPSRTSKQAETNVFAQHKRVRFNCTATYHLLTMNVLIWGVRFPGIIQTVYKFMS